MSMKRIIPCLDVDKGRVVKGKQFQDIQDVAGPITLAKQYNASGADELTFYDITATSENRSIFLGVVKQIAAEISIPFTVGGGIRTVKEMREVLHAGADKVSINSAAVQDPLLIKQAASEFGSQCVVLSIDAKKTGVTNWEVYTNGGQNHTGWSVTEWAKKGEQLGAGEIVLNAIDKDGEKNGYDLDLVEAVVNNVNIPVIASGGAGNMEHFREVLQPGRADGALGASVFHYGEIQMSELKAMLANSGIAVRKGEFMNAETLQFNQDGLIPAIIQDASDGRVLTLAYMNRAALDKTLETGETWLFSRSRQTLWHKGETSGNTQSVKHIKYDCDQDALLLQVEPYGPACHTGEGTCFHHTLYGTAAYEPDVMTQLVDNIHKRRVSPVEEAYTSYLFREGIDKILKKVGEETSEVIIGAKNNDHQEVTWEIADLTYHMLVLMEVLGVSIADIKKELYRRHIEKAGGKGE